MHPLFSANLPAGLRLLDLSDNFAGGPLPNLASAPLAWVNLTNNQLTGALPASFDKAAESLVVLSLTNNSLSGGECACALCWL